MEKNNSKKKKEIFLTKSIFAKNDAHSKNSNNFEIKSLSQKVNDYFSRFYFVKLEELGEDRENYGDMVLNGETYHPLKINLNYIMKRAKEKELAKMRHKRNNYFEKINIIDDYSEFNFNNGKNNLIKKLKYSDLNLKYIKSKNKNKSMENLPILNMDKNKDTISTEKLNEKDFLDNSLSSEEINKGKTSTIINNINRINKKSQKHKKRHKNKIKVETDNSLPKLNNKIMITNKNYKLFIQTNKSEFKTDINRKNHILRRNAFLKRYDKKEGINKRLKLLNNELVKLNNNIIKVRNKSNEDIPQFNLRFNNIMKKLKKS